MQKFYKTYSYKYLKQNYGPVNENKTGSLLWHSKLNYDDLSPSKDMHFRERKNVYLISSLL